MKYVDFMNRGYIVLAVRPEKVQADFFHLDGVGEGQGEERFAAAYATFDGEARVLAMDRPELPGL